MIDQLRSDFPQIKQYARLTVVIDDPNKNFQLNSSNVLVKQYDILSVQPTTEKAFMSVCSNVDFDILSLDMSNRISFLVKHKQAKQLHEKKVQIEITYTSFMASDDIQKRYALSNAMQLVRSSGGKNIIFSSGTLDSFKLRGPEDVSNMAVMMGINDNGLAMKTVTENPRTTIFHAAARLKTYRGVVMEVKDIHDFEDGLDYVSFQE
ncbi:RNase P subunit p30 domain-containing protein [Rozella allomycis CSF55]|uniref:RNase P subunit p30 domain-containing protein n=1 Tax=Rozella allomycis (strain CSF55) TaxID=988480 RepID=A0A075AS45_ROZAC|nr:RNase P subunit p30 domain-containing protein [Rozella allomycis CSF55]|eukprot:EPZ31378.1 RNase P subunit p30 domain-containing protein [Rozella allomycis CSF55]